MYNYKCYIQNLVSFDDNAKASNLYLGGWITDDTETLDGIGHIEPSSTNESMLSRNGWFRKSIFTSKKTSDYSEDGYTFLAPLKALLDNNVCSKENSKAINLYYIAICYIFFLFFHLYFIITCSVIV